MVCGGLCRVFPRPFTHERRRFVPHMGGQVPGDKTLMGRTHEGGHRPYGGPNFDTLYHKQKVLLINVKLQCNLPPATILLIKTC